MAEQEIPGPAWIPGFIAALRELGQVKAACKAIGKGERTVHRQRNNNQIFARAWRDALPPKPEPTPEAASARWRGGGWRTPFLEALAETSNVTASAIRANVPLRTVYKARRGDAAFAAAWLVALHEGYDMLEMELLCYLRDPQPERKMDVTAAMRLLAAHRETVERRRALTAEEDQQASVEALDAFLEGMRQRRLANTAILLEDADGEDADDGRG